MRPAPRSRRPGAARSPRAAAEPEPGSGSGLVVPCELLAYFLGVAWPSFALSWGFLSDRELLRLLGLGGRSLPVSKPYFFTARQSFESPEPRAQPLAPWVEAQSLAIPQGHDSSTNPQPLFQSSPRKWWLPLLKRRKSNPFVYSKGSLFYLSPCYR